MPEHSPLHDLTSRAGAQFTEEAGWLMPDRYGDVAAEYRNARERAALFDVSDRSKVELTGPEAVSFLQNLSTNDIASLPVGAGCEIFLTNAQARVVAHALVYRLLLHDDREALWLDAVPGLAEKIIKHLDHYLISEQAEFADRTGQFAQVQLAGPEAKAVLEKALAIEVPDLDELQHMMRTFGTDATCHIRRHSPIGVPGYDITCLAARAPAVWETLTRAGAAPAGLAAYELLRVEAGTPVYGKDMDEANLALEVGRTKQAICYTKGCFLGQEPLVRIRDLGHVNRTLLGLIVEGNELLPRGTKLFRDGKEVGQVTSSVASPRAGSRIALAYVRRGHQEVGTKLEIEGTGSRRIAEVVCLPFSSTKSGVR
jgi:glycine cleavage system T protein